jgi:L-amino acid N-acyltransferase YncA
MDLLIREARPSDAEGIVRVLNPIIEAGLYTVLDTSLTVEEEREFITRFPRRGVFHVAQRRHDQTIVGFQNVAPFADYTHAFDHVGVLATYVDLSLRRQGISKQLFPATLDAAKRNGFEKIFTFIRADNPAALAAYLHQGFRIIGTAQRQARVHGKYVDEIMVERFL